MHQSQFSHIIPVRHCQPHIVLREVAAIDGVEPPIKPSENWPADRRWRSLAHTAETGVFVVYVSESNPSAHFGRPGDLWLTNHSLSVKSLQNIWTLWHPNAVFLCPYAPARRLVWGHTGYFKYLAQKGSEANAWNNQKPLSMVSEHFDTPQVAAICSKDYASLTDQDMIALLHLRYQYEMEKLENAMEQQQVTGPSSTPAIRTHNVPLFDGVPPPNRSILDARYNAQLFDNAPPLDDMLLAQEDMDVNTNTQTGKCHLLGIRLGAQTDLLEEYCLPSAQPTYRPFPVNKYAKPSGERKHSERTKCWNNMELFLPFSPDPDYLEREMCKWIAKGRDATAPPLDSGLPLVAVLDAPPPTASFSQWREHVALVRDVLANGRVVVVCGFQDSSTSCEWSAESLSEIAKVNVENSSIQWHSSIKNYQDSLQQDPDRPYVPTTTKGSLSQFLQAAENSKDRVNCLDLPMNGFCPSQVCLNATTYLGYFNPKAKHGKGRNTQNTLPFNHTQEMSQIEWDAIRLRSWALFASAGTYTWPHHNAAGLSTYVLCKTGAKIWSYLQPKKRPTSVAQAIEQYAAIAKCTLNPSELEKIAEPVNLLLEPRTLLIQPLGFIHHVYTLENSIFLGGHFLMKESMHITELCHAHAALSKQENTNASHSSVTRLMACMVLTLAFQSPAQSIQQTASKEAEAEHVAAQEAIKLIFEYNEISRSKIKPLPWLLPYGKGSFQGPLPGPNFPTTCLAICLRGLNILRGTVDIDKVVKAVGAKSIHIAEDSTQPNSAYHGDEESNVSFSDNEEPESDDTEEDDRATHKDLGNIRGHCNSDPEAEDEDTSIET
ncbi:hypothetical protein BDW22DRAFT_1343038 [Trametopsis cervina]|nr:hypothetical protein BDW22DRAFT_1343038 [Trametopsis cervina]